jgi:hypothetical protein
MHSIQPIKRRFVMSKILSTTTAIITLGLAAMGIANAANYHDYHPWAQASGHTGYAGPVSLQHYYAVPGYVGQVHFRKYHQARAGYASKASELWEQGVSGLACDMPSSTCSNNERIND